MGLSVTAQCGGSLSSELSLCRLEWPLGVRLGTCWPVAVPRALLSRAGGQPNPAPQPGTPERFPASGLCLG